MAPLRTYTNWNARYQNDIERKDPYRRYLFLCEGTKTEVNYIKGVIDNKKALNIKPGIDIDILEKTESDEGKSSPELLIQLADDYKSKTIPNFDKKFDRIVIVFDLDIYINNWKEYEKVRKNALQKEYIIAVTNPSFELFLLLHKQNSLQNIILPNKEEILANNWVINGKGKKRFVNDLFFKQFKINPKTNKRVRDFAVNLPIAIEQEKKINQDSSKAEGVLTSNLAYIFESIMNNE